MDITNRLMSIATRIAEFERGSRSYMGYLSRSTDCSPTQGISSPARPTRRTVGHRNYRSRIRHTAFATSAKRDNPQSFHKLHAESHHDINKIEPITSRPTAAPRQVINGAKCIQVRDSTTIPRVKRHNVPLPASLVADENRNFHCMQLRRSLTISQ